MGGRFLFSAWATGVQDRPAELQLQEGRDPGRTSYLRGRRIVFSGQPNGEFLSDGAQRCFGRAQRNHSAAAGRMVRGLQPYLQCALSETQRRDCIDQYLTDRLTTIWK